jgi:hypothetical protein
MNKAETIAKYGEEAWQRIIEQRRAYYSEHKEEEKACVKVYDKEHKEEEKARNKKYQEQHPEEVIAHNQELNRKGGKHYEKQLAYNRTGLRADRNKVRLKHRNQYRPYKAIIAPNSQLHHEWIQNTDEYRGVALVEAEQHMHGIVDVIEILDGEIILLTEEEVKKGGEKYGRGDLY